MIFNQFANFLNSFDPSVAIEFSYINQIGRNEEVQASLQIPDQHDGFDTLRLEFREMLKSQIVKGNKWTEKGKVHQLYCRSREFGTGKFHAGKTGN